jgi:hypothetical protein
MQQATDITIKFTVSADDVQTVIDLHKKHTGKYPSKKWVTEFVK